eukprot:363662-Chlamydomonas_euryale.AAC.21
MIEGGTEIASHANSPTSFLLPRTGAAAGRGRQLAAPRATTSTRLWDYCAHMSHLICSFTAASHSGW